MKEKIVVTLTQSEAFSEGLDEFLAATGWEYIPRGRRGLDKLRKETGALWVVVWSSEGPVLYGPQGRLFFHPSMAKNRISQHRKGLTVDVMERVVGVRANDKFLDCTLGLGADAIVASYIAGEQGQVVGLESSEVLAFIVSFGMRYYRTDMVWLQNAIRRVRVINVDHLEFLRRQPSQSYDIVYFDPMFRVPVSQSQPLSPLRLFADHRPLSGEVLNEALRVARRRVVMKERKDSAEFARLGIEQVVGGESSRVAYGIIEKGGKV